MNSKAFEDKVISLSTRIYPMVARLLGSGMAEDAIQEIMMKLWDKRKQFANHPNISGYVFLAARNYCLDLLKKKKLNIDSSNDHLMIVASTGEQDSVEWKELKQMIENILQELPEQQCEVMKMRDIDGYEFAEIAAAMTLKVEHVRVLVSRARKHVRKKLKEIYHYEK